MTNARVLCFGGRNYFDAEAINAALIHLLCGEFGPRPAIIHGDARGADSACGAWGKRRGLPVIAVAANWDVHGKAAGFMRNDWMMEYCMPTYAVGFPGGPGTKNMADKLAAAGVVTWFPYDKPKGY